MPSSRSKRRNSTADAGLPKSPRRQESNFRSAAAGVAAQAASSAPLRRAAPSQSAAGGLALAFTSSSSGRPQSAAGGLPALAAASSSSSAPPKSAAGGLAALAATSSGGRCAVRPATSRPRLPSSDLNAVPTPQTPQRHAGRRRTNWIPRDTNDGKAPPVPVPNPSPRSLPTTCRGPGIAHTMSYASVLKGNRNQVPKLSSLFQNFLNKFHSSKRGRGMDRLWIEFGDVLKHDKNLAYAICSSQDRFTEWVFPTVIHFLTGERTQENIVEIMKGGDPAKFNKMPRSIKLLADLLRENGSLVSIKSCFDGSKLCVASDLGLRLVHSCLVEIFKCHMEDLSWNGEFDITEMVFIDSIECKITKQPESVVSDHKIASDRKIKDFRKVQEIFMPYFNSEVGMPLFFDVLQQDLTEVNENDVKDELFREYMLSHVALKSSMARFNLVCALHLDADNFGTKSLDISTSLAAIDKLKGWRIIIPCVKTDVLNKVYWFKFVPTPEAQEPFDDTARDLLKYMRHFLQHAQQHVTVDDDTELEQFLAKKFHQALPCILRTLLKDCKIHIRKPLAPHWKAYRDSKIGNGGDIEGRTGRW